MYKEEASNFSDFLTDQGIHEIHLWKLTEISESKLKMCNVKLKNDPTNHLYMEGTALDLRIGIDDKTSL